MSEHIARTLEDAERKLSEQQATVKETKKLINMLCGMMGQPARYLDLDEPEPIAAGARRGDEYYGRPLSSVVKAILVHRDRSGLGPATVNEIYSAMVTGGYKFETDVADNAKRGLRISLGKNTATFHKLPTGKFGLLEWYPAVKATKPKNGRDEDDSDDPDDSSEAGASIEEFVESLPGRESSGAAKKKPK